MMLFKNKAQGLLINNAVPSGSEELPSTLQGNEAELVQTPANAVASDEDFVFSAFANIKTPTLNNNPDLTTPISKLQHELLEDTNSPAVSVDSMGFLKIQPLSIEKPVNDGPVVDSTSPLKVLRKERSDLELDRHTPVSHSASLQTLNTFYSANSVHSSASETSAERDRSNEEDLDRFQSTVSVQGLLRDADAEERSNPSDNEHSFDHDTNYESANSTVNSETLLEIINSPVTNNTSPQSNKNESKFLMFTNQFHSNRAARLPKHISTVTTGTTLSSYYGDYDDGYVQHGRTSQYDDDDRTPIVHSFNMSNEKFEEIIQEQTGEEEFEDLNKTPLVRQIGFEENRTPKVESPVELQFNSPAAATVSRSLLPAQGAPALKKHNSGGSRFLSKFKKKIRSGHSRGQSINESMKSSASGRDDLTSMDNDMAAHSVDDDDALLHSNEYKEYALKVSPPLPPTPQTPGQVGIASDDFNFVSPGNINSEGIASSSTSNTTIENSAQSTVEEDGDSLYHSFHPSGKSNVVAKGLGLGLGLGLGEHFEAKRAVSNEGSVSGVNTGVNTAVAGVNTDNAVADSAIADAVTDNTVTESTTTKSTTYPVQYDDNDEVHIEQLDKNDYLVGVDSKNRLKLSPAKSIRKSNLIKSPNELNKDIFEGFKPSYVTLSPSSSNYENFSPLTNTFSVNTSQLDKRDIFSPTDSTFSSLNGEKRHTQVKLLNRSTTNLYKSTIDEDEDADYDVEDADGRSNEPLGNSRMIDEFLYEKYLDQPDILRELNNTEDDNFARLFLTATHPFDSSTLESQDEAARCLSFNKDDIAFIHDISESSGWAEVTLLSYKIETGWVPLNYFKPTIDDDDKQPLLLLFKSAGNFLSNRQSRPIYSTRTGELKGYSFPYTTIDKITIGVKYFLSEIGCLSSKNENVYLSKVIREVRKKLLQDWHILRKKSRDYAGTMNISKIELLELLVYQVLMKAIMFLAIWKSENVYKTKTNLDKFRIDNKARPYLSYTPTLRERVKEDSTIMIAYFSLIIGRMDLIEHNITGIQLLKILAQHLVLLHEDFVFVVRAAQDLVRDDYSAALESLAMCMTQFAQSSDLLIATTRKEYGSNKAAVDNVVAADSYQYTEEGKKLVETCALLILLVNKVMGVELALSRDRIKTKVEHKYIDFQKRKLDPRDFIEQLSIGLLESNKYRKQLAKRKAIITPRSKYAKRFSVFRNGKSDSLMLTPEGVDLLNDMISSSGKMSPMFNEGEFQDLDNGESLKENPYYVKNVSNEIIKDSNGVLIGSSFRGLVYFLTNELEEPSLLYISTLFLSYKTFASGDDLLDALITRFGANLKETAGMSDIRLKNRRKLILRMITIWLSSYWNRRDDFKLLPKLLNFLNECASDFLPLETLQLIRTVCTLINLRGDDNKQLVPRPLLPEEEPQDKRFSTIMMSAEDEDYGLTLIQSNESLNSLASISSATLSRSDMQEIESATLNYRTHIGPHWSPHKVLSELIGNWYRVRNTKMRFPAKPLLLVEFHSLDVAKQLTLIESEMFNSIKIEELLNENFTEKKLHLNLSPNVRKSILFTNSMSEYVLETVLQPEIAIKQRAKILTKWLKIALHCFNLKNFNSLAAIMTSLQSFLISRCTKIWSLLSSNYKRLFEKLIKIIQPDKNYLIYRKKLLNYLNDKDQTIVPYLNLFLQDLTFIMEGNSNYRSAKTFLNQKLINIDKYFKITKILGDLQKLQKEYKSSSGMLSSSSSGQPYNDYLKKSSSSSKIRRSLSRLSLMSSGDLSMEVIDYLPLQELIFLELLRVRQLNIVDDDRSWKLSCLIQPREN